jgi:hypothetical protein
MIFNSNTVQEYIKNGCKLVATIRKKGYYKAGKRVTLKLGDRKLRGRVVAVIPLSSLSLSQHVGYSGFRSVEEWMGEAERIHKARIDEEKFEIVVVEVL